jgi:hypothetical protein
MSNGLSFGIVCTGVVIFALGVAGCVSGCGNGYSEGTRTGTITKFSNKGLIWKSYEGEMNLGGMRSVTDDKGNASMVPNVWEFHASDAMAPRVTEAQKSGRPVSIAYRQWVWSPITQSASYDVTGVTVEP